MTTTPKNSWAEYYENTKNRPTSALLIKALEYVKSKNKAIDIGGGATLKDARYLLSLGFETTIIDKEEIVAASAKEIRSEKFHYYITSFADFDFPENEYDIASAMYALPFNSPEDFDRIFENIKKSLVKDGIFCGQFFGNNDEWHLNPKMSFHSKKQVIRLLDGMEIIFLEEKEYDGKIANGSPKHWHLFDVIARKKYTNTRRCWYEITIAFFWWR